MINPESDVYRIETLQDVFENVPRDRIDLCMQELAIALKMARDVKEVHDMLGGDPDHSVFPGYVDWVDDDEAEYQFDVSNQGDPMFSLNFSGREQS